MNDLIDRLRALSRYEHSDYSIGDEAADELEAAHVEREVIVDEALKYADKSGRLEAKVDRLAEALRIAEAALADIGDADREPGDDVAWCERRASLGLRRVRDALLHDHNKENPS